MASPFERPQHAPASNEVADRDRRCEARLFGGFRVLDADGSNATPTGRKARALIAYLLLAEGAAIARDRLATLLWSERGEDQARASLRQTLYEMRALTSGTVPFVVLDRTQAHADTSRVVTDIDRIREAATNSDAPALALLVGDKPQELLADLDGIDPAFDEWLTIERARRHDDRRRTILAVADQMLATNDAASAHRLAMSLLAGDGNDEASARLAMEASHRHGDRDGVRQTFARLQNSLRQDLGIAPSEETIATHRRLMAAQVPQVSTEHGAEGLEAANDDPMHASGGDAPIDATNVAAPSRHRSAKRRLGIPVAIAVIIAIAAVGLGLRFRDGVSARQRVLIVESMQVAASDQGAYAMSVGLAPALAHMLLGNDPLLNVVDATQTAKPSTAGTSFFVEGDAQTVGPTLHVSVKLLREKRGTILWSNSFARPLVEVDAMREQVATRIADVAVCALGSGNAKLEELDAQTIRLMLGACEEKHGNWVESVKLLQQVVAKQPDFAHGWAMLSAATAVSAYAGTGDTSALAAQTETYAQHALALDAHQGEAWFARGIVLGGIANWSRRMAMLEAGRAAEPVNAQISSSFAHLLASVGRTEEAAVNSQRAVAADPFSAMKAAQRLRLLTAEGDVPHAGIAALAAHRRFANERSTSLADFRLAALIGDTNHAAQVLANPERGFTLQPDRAAMWKALIAMRAAPSTAHNDDAYRAFVASMQAHPTISVYTLEALSMLKRVDEAYANSDRMTPERLDNDESDVLFTPVMAPLRADPRFMTLAARMGLVRIWQQTDRWPDFCNDKSVSYDCRVEARRAMSADARPLVAALTTR